MTATTHHHTIGISGVVTCHAPKGSRCRLICDSGCEEWTFEDHEHALVDAGACGTEEFLNGDPFELVEMYAGDETPLRDGPIAPAWLGDYFEWSYAENIDRQEQAS